MPALDPNEECWEFDGARDKDGYGFIRINGWNNRRAHRVTFAWANGYWRRNGGDIGLPEGMIVMHTCDNPPCVNPRHLKLGTTADNMAEKVRKNRTAGQRRTHCSKGHELTPENVFHPLGKKSHRQCKICRKAQWKRAHIRKRERRASIKS